MNIQSTLGILERPTLAEVPFDLDGVFVDRDGLSSSERAAVGLLLLHKCVVIGLRLRHGRRGGR